MTLSQIVGILKSIALSQPNVRTATDGSIYEKLNTNPSVQYDVFHISQTTHYEDFDYDHYGFNLFYVSRLEDSLENNRLQLQSLGKEILGNILRTFCENFDVDLPRITYTPFTQRFTDECAGVYCALQLDVPKEIICPDDFIQEVIPGKPIKLQDLGITITENGLRVITPAPGYDGIGEIRIDTNVPQEPVNLQHKEVEYSDNGIYSIRPDQGYDGLSDVSVSVNVATGSSNADLIANIEGRYFIIPEDTTSIRPKAFADCQFSAITIPDTVESIGYEAFAYNYELETITIPSSVSSIGYSAFIDCPLTSMTFEGMVPPQIEWDSLGWGDMEFPIYVPCQALRAYQEAFAEQYADRIQCNLKSMPFTIVAETDGILKWSKGQSAGSAGAVVEYSKNGGEWTTITAGTNAAEISVVTGDMVQFRGNNNTYNNYTGSPSSAGFALSYTGGFNGSTCRFSAMGNITSLFYGADFEEHNDMKGGRLAGMFRRCTGLTDASYLVFPTFFEQAYTGGTHSSANLAFMFSGCTNLANAPELPLHIDPYWTSELSQTTDYAFYGMFQGCTSLTTAPELPYDYIAKGSCHSMFQGCTSLTTAPELVCSEIYIDGCNYMFGGCTGITYIPVFQNLERVYLRGCQGMFTNCTSLTSTPELPATILYDYCYNSMFAYCTSITSVPDFPQSVTWMRSSDRDLVYDLPGHYMSGMFSYCSSLVNAPALPVGLTTGCTYCYKQMFEYCTSLRRPPVLASIIVPGGCYWSMFKGCTSLTTAPELPATTLAVACYQEMFRDCSSLNYIKCPATSISATSATTNWVSGVSSAGTFEKASGMTGWTTGNNGIPSGWTVINEGDYSVKPLTFLAHQSASIYLNPANSGKTIQYKRTLDSNWITMTINRLPNSNKISLPSGSTLEIKGNSPVWSTFFYGTQNQFTVYGNIMSLVAGDGFATATTLESAYTFNGLFGGQTNIIDASNLVLPATSLTESCYNSMFQGCTALTAAPAVLPATNLSGANGCYQYMFNECQLLTGTPVICATTLSDYCFENMFNGCNHLIDASSLELPATTLTEGCYGYMFYGCSSLTGAPVLSATTLAPSCYAYMFSYCSSLDTAPALPATDLTDAGYCYDNMFAGCQNLTGAPNLPATALSESCYADMFSWCENLTGTPVLACMNLEYECYRGMFQGCTSLTTAPALPATTLADDCYRYMFIGCSSLTGAPVLPATALTNACYAEMFQDCSSLVNAPELLAPIMTNECYRNMFTNCESLQYIKCLATGNTEESDGGCCFTDSWVEGVPEGGTFVKDANMSDWEIDSNNGIPYNWTVQDDN